MKTKQRGPLTPKKRGLLPGVLLISYTDHDEKQNRLLTDSHLLEVYHRLLAKDFTPLKRATKIIGERLLCCPTVELAIERHGGAMHHGWLLCPQTIGTGRNCCARYELNPHCVWENDGQLEETIPAYFGLHFILDDKLPHGCQAGMNFLDTPADGWRVTFDYDNLRSRIIKLGAK